MTRRRPVVESKLELIQYKERMLCLRGIKAGKPLILRVEKNNTKKDRVVGVALM